WSQADAMVLASYRCCRNTVGLAWGGGSPTVWLLQRQKRLALAPHVASSRTVQRSRSLRTPSVLTKLLLMPGRLGSGNTLSSRNVMAGLIWDCGMRLPAKGRRTMLLSGCSTDVKGS